MSTKQNWWRYGSRILAPIGLIVGTTSGTNPEGFQSFTAADGRYLKGTISDANVGTTGGSVSWSYYTGYGGNHSSGPGNSGAEICNTSSSSCPSSCCQKSWNGYSYGSHRHTASGTYYPKRNLLRLIQATEEIAVPLNSIMFSTTTVQDQTRYTAFENSGFLYANTSTGVSAASQTDVTSSASMSSHNHHTSVDTKVATGVASGYYTDVSSGGGSHSHSLSVTITNNIYRTALRVWQVLEPFKLDGLIGMYIGEGLPDGWTYVTELNNRYAQTTSTGDGSQSGTGQITCSGSTGSSSHAHYFSGSSSYMLVGSAYHNGLSHTHSSSGTVSFNPSYYYIKFIRYTG